MGGRQPDEFLKCKEPDAGEIRLRVWRIELPRNWELRDHHP